MSPVIKVTREQWHKLGQFTDRGGEGSMEVSTLLLERASSLGIDLDQYTTYETLASAIADKLCPL